jgi:hypothetical protein
MKKIFLLSMFLSLFTCGKGDNDTDIVDNIDNINQDFFECTVDYVQFVDEENAIVRFEITLGKETNYFYGRYSYIKDGNNYTIGDDIVYINNFQTVSDKEAKFRFIYGGSLGFFCAQVFEELPAHIHQNFDAEAELEILPTERVVGKWKIKKKSNFSLER